MTRISRPQQTSLPDDIGECISQDDTAVSHLGWEEFVWRRQVRGDFAGLEQLRQYKFWGAPVVLAGKWWTKDQHMVALKRGPHKSALEQTPFLFREFASMMMKGQWVVLLYSVAKWLQGLWLIPPRR